MASVPFGSDLGLILFGSDSGPILLWSDLGQIWVPFGEGLICVRFDLDPFDLSTILVGLYLALILVRLWSDSCPV